MLTSIPIDVVLRKLGKVYTPPRTFLDWTHPHELMVATILAAQCTDKRVNIVTKTLFQKYKSPADYLKVSNEELQDDIHSCGHYRNKSKFIQGSMRKLIEDYRGKMPDAMEKLLEFPGVGRKTAAVLLYAIFKKNEGLAVDTHVWRVSKRLGLTKAKSQDGIERDLMKQAPREKWGYLHTLLIMHGRNICIARDRKCEQCVFQKECPSSTVMGRGDSARNEELPVVS